MGHLTQDHEYLLNWDENSPKLYDERRILFRV